MFDPSWNSQMHRIAVAENDLIKKQDAKIPSLMENYPYKKPVDLVDNVHYQKIVCTPGQPVKSPDGTPFGYCTMIDNQVIILKQIRADVTAQDLKAWVDRTREGLLKAWMDTTLLSRPDITRLREGDLTPDHKMDDGYEGEHPSDPD